jgi:hypothetical protein
VMLQFRSDGAIVAYAASTSSGQGHETVFPAIVAGRLGVDPSRIELRASDPDGPPAFWRLRQRTSNLPEAPTVCVGRTCRSPSMPWCRVAAGKCRTRSTRCLRSQSRARSPPVLMSPKSRSTEKRVRLR